MKKSYFSLAVGTVAAVVATSCASYEARQKLENVAKGWCETIRASQVIPVYPLTEDLVVGDVFLVRTPISQQESDYNKKGFLPLDDSLVRLKYTSFTNVYFNSYWTNTFGNTPHATPYFTNNGAYAATLTAAEIPRAAFPSYSFTAQSGFGVNLALPIEGVPVALSYLNSQHVDGSITISDARTYAGDFQELHELIETWSADEKNKMFLADAALNAYPRPIYLRVVSRVYYARAIDVALHRADSQGAGAKGGVVNDVSLTNGTNTSASVAANTVNTNLLQLLTQSATTAASAAQAGGAVKFVSASDSTVGLSQSFDRLLAVGYLGFDVPVSTNGEIGMPIPTFQHLTGKISAPAHPIFAMPTLTVDAPDLAARKKALIAQLQGAKASQEDKVLANLGLTADAKVLLQNRIADAHTDDEVKAIEDAFAKSK